MFTIRHFTGCFIFLAAVLTVATVSALNAAESNTAPDKERLLIGVLQSDAPAAEKAIACKQLAIFGSPNAVPALAPLLADERLASWARIALEAIPGPEANGVLREAAAKLDGKLLVGVINTIGVRRDANAVKILTGHLKNQDAQIAEAAALALGRVGNAEATQTLLQSLTHVSAPLQSATPGFLFDTPLQQSLTHVSAPHQSAVAEGCILCAEQLLATGRANEAAEVYDQVRQAKLPKQRILEATRGAILARGAAGVPLLVEQLRSEDKAFFQIGLATARELSGRDVTDAITAELSRTSPERGALLLQAFADRGDKAALPVVLQTAKSGPPLVRIAAIGVVRSLGNQSCIPTLLDVALETDKELSQAAKAALSNLPGEGVDKELTARLETAKDNALPLLIEIIGQRQIAATTPLIKAVDHPSAKVRRAALRALGATVGPKELAVLVSRVADPRHPDDTPTAQQALRTACIRMPDREACAKQLVAAMPGASVPTQCGLLEILGAMEGETALHAMGDAAKSSKPELQDRATRLLGKWMSVDAGPVLLELARTPDFQYNIRSLRGYIRLVRQFSIPAPRRAAMCREALESSRRTDEKKLVLAVMERYPSLDMLKLAVQIADDPAIKNDTIRVARAIAQKLDPQSAEVQKLLAQIGQETK